MSNHSNRIPCLPVWFRLHSKKPHSNLGQLLNYTFSYSDTVKDLWKQAVFVEPKWPILFIHYFIHFNGGTRKVKNLTSAAGTVMFNVCEVGLEHTVVVVCDNMLMHLHCSFQSKCLKIPLFSVRIRCSFTDFCVLSFGSDFTCRSLTLRCISYV